MLIDLRLRGQARQFASAAGERLLYSGLRSGLDLPYECASGTCGSCKAKLVSGEVENLWTDAPGRKLLGGTNEVLLCQSAALRDCQLEVSSRSQEPVPNAVPILGKGIVRRRRLLTQDVLAFSLDIDRAIDFDAGQFVCLQFPQATGFRSYSIVNFSRACTRLDFVLKRKADGRLTPLLFDGEIEGCEVEWFGPLGRAIYAPGDPRPILCIAGGTGIAGIMSILRCASEAGHFSRSTGSVFFGVRTRSDTFYLSELNELVGAANGGLEVTVALSEDQPDQAVFTEYPSLRFRSGFVHDAAKSAMTGRFDGVVAYLAGPKPAVDAAMRVLLSARVPVQSMRFDRFN